HRRLFCQRSTVRNPASLLRSSRPTILLLRCRSHHFVSSYVVSSYESLYAERFTNNQSIIMVSQSLASQIFPPAARFDCSSPETSHHKDERRNQDSARRN